MSSFKIVGHRGFPQCYPENTLVGMHAALAAGADALEFDVQVSLDGELVVVHDENLKRVAELDRPVCDCKLEELQNISVHEPRRFGDAFFPTPLHSLQAFVEGLRVHAQTPLFVEIKAEIFKKISRQACLDKIPSALNGQQERCVLISFDLEFLRIAQRQTAFKLGWVLSAYDAKEQAEMAVDPFDYLICDFEKIHQEHELWSGPWQWFVYDIVTQEQLQRCIDLGVTWIETWDTGAIKSLALSMGPDSEI